MNLYSALKSIFSANTSAASTGARIPLINNLGNVVGAATYGEVATKMNVDFRKEVYKNTGPVLWKIWQISGSGSVVLKLYAYRQTTSDNYEVVEMIGGRYSGSKSYDLTRPLKAEGISSYFKLYKKHEGSVMTYYVQLSTTSKKLGLQVSQIMGTGGELLMEESDEDVATLTEISLNRYDLQITVSANGYATFNGMKFTDGTNTFNIMNGMDCAIFLSPNSGYRIKSVKKNNTDVTSSVVDNRYYTVSAIAADTEIAIEYEADV